MLFVILVLAFIRATVFPGEFSKAMHFILLPVASEYTTIGPLVGSLSINHVVNKQSAVAGSISPLESALALFDAINERTIVTCTVFPLFNTIAMLEIFVPRTRIMIAVRREKLAWALSLVIVRFTYVNLLVLMGDAASITIGMASLKVALNEASVWGDQDTEPLN